MREVFLIVSSPYLGLLTTAEWVKSLFVSNGWSVISVELKALGNSAPQGSLSGNGYQIRANVRNEFNKEQIAQNAANVAAAFASLPISVAVFDADNTILTKYYESVPPKVNAAGKPVQTNTPTNTAKPPATTNNGGNNNNQPKPDPEKESELWKAYKKLADDLHVSPTTLGVCAAALFIVLIRNR